MSNNNNPTLLQSYLIRFINTQERMNLLYLLQLQLLFELIRLRLENIGKNEVVFLNS